MPCSARYRRLVKQTGILLILLTFHWVSASITREDVVDKTRQPDETTLTSKDFANVALKEIDLRKLGIDVPDDPTMGKKSEGDILMHRAKVFRDETNPLGRNAIRQTYRKWPNNEIPYTLSTQYGQYSRSVIAKAMNEYHTKTCVRFVPRDAKKHRDYVYIHPDDGCYSLVGRVGGRQPLSLDSGCIQTGTIVHELMHTVGFFHEQSRYDRDLYIDIVWPNVISGADDQFEKYGTNVIDHLHEPYDYASIMHYGPYAFSANGKRTILARKPGAQKMGQRVQFSEVDLRKLNRLYQCEPSIKKPAKPPQTPSSTTPAPASTTSSTTTTAEPASTKPNPLKPRKKRPVKPEPQVETQPADSNRTATNMTASNTAPPTTTTTTTAHPVLLGSVTAGRGTNGTKRTIPLMGPLETTFVIQPQPHGFSIHTWSTNNGAGFGTTAGPSSTSSTTSTTTTPTTTTTTTTSRPTTTTTSSQFFRPVPIEVVDPDSPSQPGQDRAGHGATNAQGGWPGGSGGWSGGGGGETEAEEGCADKNWRCAFWAMSVFGYCDQYAEIRDQVCPLSCGACDRPGVAARRGPQRSNRVLDCVDKSAACARIGPEACESPLTQLLCARVCGACADVGRLDDADAAAAEDERAPAWARRRSTRSPGQGRAPNQAAVLGPGRAPGAVGALPASANPEGNASGPKGNATSPKGNSAEPRTNASALAAADHDANRSFFPPPLLVAEAGRGSAAACFDVSDARTCAFVRQVQLCRLRLDCARTCRSC